MTFPIYQVVFYLFAVLLIMASLAVITVRNPVRAALFTIAAFFCCSVLWMLMEAEFLALALIFVYVGAVMTLFLFVVMMLNIDMSNLREGFAKILPYAALVLILTLVSLCMVVWPTHLGITAAIQTHHVAHYSNVKSIGDVLYSDYLYPFEVAGAILLVAMVSAITLAFFGRKPHTKFQNINEQHRANKKDRLRIVKMKSEGDQ